MDPLTIAALGATALKGVSGFLGSKKSEKAALRAQQEAAAAYAAGVGSSKKEINASAGKASGLLQPYAESGGKANTLYSDALGVNGRPAQEAFFSSFLDDPGFQEGLDAGRQQIEHSSVVQGRSNSGATMKELFDFGQRQKYSEFDKRLTRLSGLGQQGQQAAGGQADLEWGRGQHIADLTMKGASYGASSLSNMGSIRSQGIANRTGIVNDSIGGLVSAFGTAKGAPSTSGQGFGTWDATVKWG